MAVTHVYNGTLDEIVARYGEELSGVRLNVTVDDAQLSGGDAARPLYETATADEWIEALRAWGASHERGESLLSDEAVGRESIYEGRCE